MVSGITPERRERIRRYFCTNQRRIHRRFMRVIGTLIFITSLITAGLLVVRDILNQRMLKARAEIQITVVCTGQRRGAFTELEWQRILNNWEAAEYSATQLTCDDFK